MKATLTARSSRLVDLQPAVGTGEVDRVGPDQRALAKDVEQSAPRHRHAPPGIMLIVARPPPTSAIAWRRLNTVSEHGHSSSATGFCPHQVGLCAKPGWRPLGFRRFLDPLDPRLRRPDTATARPSPGPPKLRPRTTASTEPSDAIAHPTVEAPGVGLTLGPGAEPNPLHPTVNSHANRDDSRCQPRGDPQLDGWRLVPQLPATRPSEPAARRSNRRVRQ